MSNDNTNTNDKTQRNIERACIPHRFKDADFDGYRIGAHQFAEVQRKALEVAKRYATDFESLYERGTSLAFCGAPGTGKTHLACAVANYILRRGFTALFITTVAAVRRVKLTWRSDSEKTEQQAFNSFLSPDLLILDEVGAQWGSDAEKLILFEIINERYQNRLPTIMVSNLTERELADVITARAMDRLRDDGGVAVGFMWPSYRGGQHG